MSVETFLANTETIPVCYLCNKQCNSSDGRDLGIYTEIFKSNHQHVDSKRRLVLCEKCHSVVQNLMRTRDELFGHLSELLRVTGRQNATADEKISIGARLCQFPGNEKGAGDCSDVNNDGLNVPSGEDTRKKNNVLAFVKYVAESVQQCVARNGDINSENTEELPSASSHQDGTFGTTTSPPTAHHSQTFGQLGELKRKTDKSVQINASDDDLCDYGDAAKMNARENLEGDVSKAMSLSQICLEPSSTRSPPPIEAHKTECERNRCNKSKQRKQNICTICNKTCKTARELNLHLGVHMQERKYICEVCGLAYRHKKALEVHVGLHRGEAKFECEYCQKVFTQKSGLQRHLPIHTGEMAYQCDICGKRFLYNTSFNVHKFTHTKHKGFQCFECGLSFFSKSHLKRHMKTHTGIKPHVCDKCGKCFSERYNLEAHVRVHTGQKTHQCPHCDAGFNRKRKMEEHVTKKHPELCQK